MTESLLKVVIVDDEYLVRNLLINCVKWNEFGMVIEGEAESALEALDLMEKLKPDILFVDINMPIINGIELSKTVTERYPSIKIIVLTGYEKFEYAKSCIKIGIEDILTKPIVPNEIIKSISKVKEKIEIERDNQNQLKALRVQLLENMPYARERFLNELIQKGNDSYKSVNKLKYFGIEFKHNNFQIAVVEVESKGGILEADEEEEQLMKLKYFNYIKSLSKENKFINVFFDTSQRIVLLISNTEINLMEYCDKVKLTLNNLFSCFVTVGIGNIHEDIRNIHLSFKEAIQALKYKIYVGKNQIISYGEINVSENKNINYCFHNLDDLHFYIKAGMKDEALAFIDTQFEVIKLKQDFNIDSVRVIAINTLFCIVNVLNEMEISQVKIFGEDVNPFEKVFDICVFETTMMFLKDILSKSIFIINEKRNEKESNLIKSIKKYINENMKEYELSLKKVGDAFFINQSYLSRLFKQKTGINYVEYLTDIRIQKAILLLKNSNMKMYQIAEQVGIIDPHYLGVCFKKVTGVSMSEYKKRLNL
jgi:two-component system response regulator YesN